MKRALAGVFFSILFLTKPVQAIEHIPSEVTSEVRAWLRYFAGPDRERFERVLWRGSIYQGLIQRTLIKNGLPPELYYLAMIESGFVRHAVSNANAVGIWQFMRATGKLYGLRIDPLVDERLDIIRATQAAARHLRDLKRQFGSWNLAMAAYNAGPGRVQEAIRRGHSRNFWVLSRRNILPKETTEYIPQFQAAMMIARYPSYYGFARKSAFEFPVVSALRVRGLMSLEEVARKNELPLDSLKALNPQLIRGLVPPTPYVIWVPRARRVASTQ